MLYDPKWQDNRDIFSTENLIRWLAMQPSGAKYSYQSCLNCVLAQYFMAHGMDWVRVGQSSVGWTDASGNHARELPAGWNMIAFGEGRWTFGAALQRARDVLDIERVISS